VGDEVIDPDGITSAWVPPHRHERIDELLSSQDVFTPDDMREMQLDVLDNSARRFLPGLLAAAAPSTDGGAWCLEQLKAWDYQAETDSVGAAVWAVFSQHVVEVALEDDLSSRAVSLFMDTTSPSRGLMWGDMDRYLADGDVGEALDRAYVELQETLGKKTEAWTWGALHPLRLVHSVADGRELLSRWNMAEVPFRGTGSTVAAASFSYGFGERPVTGMASLRMVVDLADPGRATLGHPGGQSGHPRHPTYASHFDTFVEGGASPLWFWDQDVEAQGQHVLELQP
jgi:penicillin amidase